MPEVAPVISTTLSANRRWPDGWITGLGAAPWVSAIPPTAPARAAAPALTALVVSSRLRL